MQDLMRDLRHYTEELDESIRSLYRNGEKLAQAEKDYKIALRQEVLRLRSKGTAVGIIDKIVYGVEEVAEARFKRDIAEAMYKANQEHINATKLHLRITESQINREWGNASTP